MFLLKKVVSYCLLPLPVCFGIVAAGLLLLWFTRRQKAGRILVTAGFGLLVLLSYSSVANLFAGALENDYRPLLVEGAPHDADTRAKAARFIVVLGGGHGRDPQLPANSELSTMTLARLVEGLRLKRQLPEAKLVLSGGFGTDGVTHADVLARAAVALGFAREDLILEKRTFDTHDEARFITPIVGTAPFILVTSGTHMPRAAALFRKQGAQPIPSPTDFTAAGSSGLLLHHFFPSADSLDKLERVNHEWLGRIWSSLRGQL
jgi:uncharacterized SAM-binding protein YcdF (DUF218 family)